MALETLKLPPLIPQSAIVDPKTGVPTQFYLDYINSLTGKLVTSVNALNTATTALQAANAQTVAQQAAVTQQSQAVAQAQADADTAAGSPAQSGDALMTVNVPAGGSWVAGPIVNLAGVVAGNLSAINSSPRQIPSTYVSARGVFTAFYRIVEVILGVDTVVFTGQIAAERFQDDTVPPSDFVNLYNQTDTTTFSAARVTAGVISYRMDISSPDVELQNVQLYVYVRRS